MLMFLIHAHKDVKQLNRLINVLTSEHSKVYVNVDKKSPLNLDLVDKRARLIKKRINIYHSGWSMVDAILNSLREIEEDNFEYSHVVYISGQDYPLVNVHEMEQLLQKNTDYINFIEISDTGWNCQERYNRFNYHDKYRDSFLLKKGIGVLNRVCERLGYKRKIPNNLVPYGGSAWWNLSQSTIQMTLDYVAANPGIRRFFRFTTCPDEIFFQTIVKHLNRKARLVNENYRYLIFLPGASRPEILDMSHAKDALASNAILARKFERPKSDELIDYIDNVRNPGKTVEQ